MPNYGLPSAAVVEALEARPRPVVEPSPDGRHVALLLLAAREPVATILEPSLGLAGRLIDPRNNGPARGILFEKIRIIDSEGGDRMLAMPHGARLSTVRWSPDGRFIAALNHTDTSIDLWTASLDVGELRPVVSGVNAGFAEPFEWLPDSSGFLVRLVPLGRQPIAELATTEVGPEIRESTGTAAPAPTLSNLLSNARDDALFRHYFTSMLAQVSHSGGQIRQVGSSAIISNASVSPDGRYALLERLLEPFSRAFSAPDFPRQVLVIDLVTGEESVVATHAGADSAGRGAEGANADRRALGWRADRGSTLAWVEVGSQPGRDRLVQLSAPFKGRPDVVVEVRGRIVRPFWSKADLAVLDVRPDGGGRTVQVAFDPSRSGKIIPTEPALLKSSQVLLSRQDASGQEVLAATETGKLIALDRGDPDHTVVVDPFDGSQEPLHRFPADGLRQSIVHVLDAEAGRALAWREDERNPPNLHLLNPGDAATVQLTHFADPAPAFANMQRMSLSFERDDGLPLSASLYLPASVKGSPPRPLSTLFWAYPVTRNSPTSVPDRMERPQAFVRPSGIDPLLLTASGHAVLIADMPILLPQGHGEARSFTEQLVANSAAAIDAARKSGWVDPARIAVAGHSFGAGMAVNLLASSDLFAGGIALSGAYNRTLTPFGFQTERRSYWEAQEAYREASPFLRADQIEVPLLLIHGLQDTNSGTLPMQSERMFAALNGMGKPARLVLLPGEGHEITGRESVLHVLHEMERWLNELFAE